MSRQLVCECQRNEDCEEQNSRENEHLSQPAAVLHVHKKQNYQQHLDDGNRKSGNGVKCAEVNVGHTGRECGETKKRDKDSDVGFHRDNVLGHQWPPPA